MEARELFKSFSENLSDKSRELLFHEFLFNDLVGINITDTRGKVLFLNDAHTRITQQSKDLYIGHTMYELEEQGIVSKSAAMEVIRTGHDYTLRQSTTDGNSFEVRGIPVCNSDGSLRMVLCLLTDVTDIVNSRKKVIEIEEYANTLKQAISGEGALVYQSTIMQKVVEKAKRIAETDVSVLISGPSGVGKEMIADIIHENSPRKDKPFIKINCAAIPENLLESELFGYEPGAFTGGNPKGKRGLIEAANGGTLLLDEIGELPLMLQSKLLRTLQARTIRHLGGTKAIKVDFRLISSTNADLMEKVQTREFRDDLYSRVNVIDIAIPPLENRRDDIPILINHFIRLFNVSYDLNKHIEPDAMQFLTQYDFPGNVRELRNIVERLMIQSSGNMITLRDAYESIDRYAGEDPSGAMASLVINNNAGLSLKEIMENYEKAILQEYIKIYKNGSELARQLKTDQSTISRKLTKYGIRY